MCPRLCIASYMKAESQEDDDFLGGEAYVPLVTATPTGCAAAAEALTALPYVAFVP